MPIRHRLLHETITYSQAREKEINVLHQLQYFPRQNEFFRYICERRELIEKLVAHHLGVHPNKCQAAGMDDWMHGSFNLCVPVTIENSRRVIIRFPLPYRVGDSFHPGNGDEKVRCEAGTYAWLQQECPDVPIPSLYGFALATGQCFTALQYLPLFPRLLQRLHRWFLSLLGRPVPSQFVRHANKISRELGAYIIIDYVDEGEILSKSWKQQCSRKELRQNLFRGLSAVMLALSRISLPNIGSFIIDDDGFLRLANRPLTLMVQDLENENIPVDISKGQLFTSVDSYVNGLLACHDNRLSCQPNGISSESDCVTQMTALALMRTIRPQFFDRSLNHGPFVFCLTDLHASNILVDKDWNIKCLLDLEWAAALPIEFMRTPIWLTGQAVDDIDTEAYNELRKEFMDAFEEEERKCPAEYNLHRSSIMENSWKSGTFWYTTALGSPTGLHAIFYDRIQPLYSEKHAEDPNFFVILCQYWVRGAAEFIKTKLEDKRAYDRRLREVFSEL